MRTILPLALIVLVLLGAWMIWPQAEPRAPVAPVPDATEALPAQPSPAEAKVEGSAPATERALAGTAPATAATKARLNVLCVARADKRMLAGVEVRVGQGEPRPTDASGRASFEVEPGRPLAVIAEDLAHFVSHEVAEVAALAPGETREVRLEHDAGETSRFHGLVVARADGRPVAGASVRVGEKPRTESGADGRFELDFAAHQAPALRVDAQGFGPALVGAGPGHESAERARRIELDRAAALVIALAVPQGQTALRVVLQAKGYEISQDQVFATSAAFQASSLKWEAQADAQWLCSFEELPPGVTLLADVIGAGGVLFHAAEAIVLEPGEQKRLEWDLRGSELAGHVFEADGKPAPQVELWLLRPQAGYRSYVATYHSRDLVGRATSDADGRYRFASVSPGTWLLAPKPVDRAPGAAPGDAIAPVPLEVTIRAGDLRSVVDVHLARGLYIRGKLVAPDGTSGVQGYVYASAASGERVHADTDGQGVFAVGPLAPGRFSLEGSAYNTFLSSLPVQAEAGARDVLLRSRPGAEVAGRVVDGASGAGVQAAITIGNDSGSMTMTRTQPDGSFRFDGLAPGRWTICASTTAGQAGELAGVVLDASAPVSGVQVVLKPGARLRIKYEGRGVGQASVRRNGASIAGDGVEAGRTTLQIVPAGKVSVEFRFPEVERPEVQELELGAGEEREVVFRLPTK